MENCCSRVQARFRALASPRCRTVAGSVTATMYTPLQELRAAAVIEYERRPGHLVAHLHEEVPRQLGVSPTGEYFRWNSASLLRTQLPWLMCDVRAVVLNPSTHEQAPSVSSRTTRLWARHRASLFELLHSFFSSGCPQDVSFLGGHPVAWRDALSAHVVFNHLSSSAGRTRPRTHEVGDEVSLRLRLARGPALRVSTGGFLWELPEEFLGGAQRLLLSSRHETRVLAGQRARSSSETLSALSTLEARLDGAAQAPQYDMFGSRSEYLSLARATGAVDASSTESPDEVRHSAGILDAQVIEAIRVRTPARKLPVVDTLNLHVSRSSGRLMEIEVSSRETASGGEDEKWLRSAAHKLGWRPSDA